MNSNNKLDNGFLKIEKKIINSKNDINDGKRNQITFIQNKFNFNKYKKIRCFSQ